MLSLSCHFIHFPSFLFLDVLTLSLNRLWAQISILSCFKFLSKYCVVDELCGADAMWCDKLCGDRSPEAEPTLLENPILISRQPMTPGYTWKQCWCSISKTTETVILHMGPVLKNPIFMYIKNDSVRTDGNGDVTKAWMLHQEKFCSVEKLTLASLGGQPVKLRLESA